MAQVAQVEQFEEKKVFFGLNKVDSWGKRARFDVIKDYIIILTQGGMEKSFFNHRRFFLALLFPDF